jgi:hypothetical protein
MPLVVLLLMLCSFSLATVIARRAIEGGTRGVYLPPDDTSDLYSGVANTASDSARFDSIAVAQLRIHRTDSVRELKQNAYLKETISQNKFDRDKWKAAKKDLDYSEEPPKKEKEKIETHTWSPSSPSIFSGSAVKFIFVGIILLLLAFLLFKIFSNRLSNKKVVTHKNIVSIEDIEDLHLVPESELERLLREALERKDFNEAIRIYYVFIIRELSEKELIGWKKEKTNRDYLAELRPTQHYALFKELTLLFERVWYGDVLLAEPDYTRISPRFKTFADSIKSGSGVEK